MQHTKLGDLMSPMEKMANVAASAAQSAREATTRQSGTISVPNADGTRSILGVQNGNGRSIATHVGDTTPPGKPLGVSAASSSGVVVAYWSGELEGGIPDDFAKLVVKAQADGEEEQVLGELYAEGSVSSNRLSVGKLYSVWATAEDDACGEDGSEKHNVSEKSDTVTVTVTAAADSAAVEAAQKAANEAKALAKTLVASVDVEYALGDTSTTAPTSGWSTESPAWTQGKYIWQRTKSVDGSGAESYSEPTCIQGAKGDSGAKGDTGVGVSAIVEEYYLSTSPTAQTGGSWGTSQPAWAESHYIWTRSKVTWTSGIVTYTQPILAKAINSANEVASKTTWHFWADSEGAHVATSKQDATSGANILLTGEGINIRQGTNVVASFSTSVIELGKNSGQSVISLCSGAGEIGAITSALGSMLALFGNAVGIKGNNSATMASPGAYAMATGDGLSLNANDSMVLGSNAIVAGKQGGNLTVMDTSGSAVLTVTSGGGADSSPEGISIENTADNGYIALTAGTRGSDIGIGIHYDNLVGGYSTRIATKYIDVDNSVIESRRAKSALSNGKIIRINDTMTVFVNGSTCVLQLLNHVSGTAVLPDGIRPVDPLRGNGDAAVGFIWNGNTAGYVYVNIDGSIRTYVPETGEWTGQVVFTIR